MRRLPRTIRRRKPLGLVLWEGPSRLTSDPVAVIATGIGRPSRNKKTGPMIQTWILRQDASPVAAINEGADVSVCGDCPLRGIVRRGVNHGRMCYVDVSKAPNQVWQAWRDGAYDEYNPQLHARYLRGRKIRLGAYGDPTAAPYGMWARLTKLADGHTGYTHQWSAGMFWRFRNLLMASVESEFDARIAQGRGWRTFRVTRDQDPLMETEVGCPAAAENGARTTCERCGLCCGASRYGRNVAIVGHGSPSRLVTLRLYLGD